MIINKVTVIEIEVIASDSPRCIGYYPGDYCGRDGCWGVLDYDQDPCYCSVAAAKGHAPCSNCENSWTYCPECDWRSDE